MVNGLTWNGFKRGLRRLFWSVGIDIKPCNPLYVVHLRRRMIMEEHGITLVLDIGANTGEYILSLRECGYKGRVISCEPEPCAYRQLEYNAKSDPSWKVFPLGCGDQEGNTCLFVAGNSESSSVLRMTPRHEAAAPNSAYRDACVVKLVTIDSLIPDFSEQDDQIFMKLDVQGYEHKVLRGAERTLSRIRVVEMEMSLVELYDDQLLFRPMLDLMDSLGYELVSIQPGLTDHRTGHVLQVDGIFVRRSGSNQTS